MKELRLAGFLAGLVLLSALAPGCRARQPKSGLADEPFRVMSADAQSVPAVQASFLAADFDGDGTPDTLCLTQQDAGTSLDPSGPTRRHVKVTVIAHPAAGRRVQPVTDETWAVDGDVTVSLYSGLKPPAFAVEVAASGGYWYRWNGVAFVQVNAPEPGAE